MCGIAGFYCFGQHRPTEKVARILFVGQEARGRDASGAAFLEIQPDGTDVITVAKEPVPPNVLDKAFEAQGIWEKIIQSPRALFHARASTKGKAANNVNNHPVVGYSWAVTHNGVVNNDDELFEHYGDERVAEVDTVVIPFMLQKGVETRTEEESFWEAAARGFTVLDGNATIAAWPDAHRDSILLLRMGYNALYMVMDVEKDILYWSSDKDTSEKLPSFVKGSVNIPAAATLGEGMGLLLNPTTHMQLMKLEMKPYRPTKRAQHSTTGFQGGTVTSENKFAWKRLDSKHIRPTPWDLIKPEQVFMHATNQHVLKTFLANKAAKTGNTKVATAIQTGYGIWRYEYDSETQKLDLSFKMRKAMKKAMRKIFGEERAYLLEDLPLPDEATSMFDEVMTYEYLQTPTTPATTYSYNQRPEEGVMCPICGAPATKAAIRLTKGVCDMCNITSLLPPGF